MKFIQPTLFAVCLFSFGVTDAQNLNDVTNGLSRTGTVARLGGTLTQATSIDMGSSFTFKFSKGASDYFFVDNGGNIGIGIGTPTAKLHTNGSVRFQGLSTSSTLTNILVTDANGNVSLRDASTFGTNFILNQFGTKQTARAWFDSSQVVTSRADTMIATKLLRIGRPWFPSIVPMLQARTDTFTAANIASIPGVGGWFLNELIASQGGFTIPNTRFATQSNFQVRGYDSLNFSGQSNWSQIGGAMNRILFVENPLYAGIKKVTTTVPGNQPPQSFANAITATLSSILVNVSGGGPTNHYKLMGHYASHVSQLRLGFVSGDTMENWAAYIIDAYSTSGKLLKGYGLHNRIIRADSAWYLYNEAPANPSFLAGAVLIGYDSTRALPSQVPDSTAILDLNTKRKGFLAPRMNTAQQNAITSPATALLIYNIDSSKFRFYDGAAWVSIGTGGGGGGGVNYWTQSGNDISYNTGNVGIGITNPDNSEAWGKLVEVRGYNHSKFLVSTTNENILTCLWSHDGAGFGGAPAGGMTGTSSNHPFSILTNKISRVTITSDGNVGIGTANTHGYKLAVNGDAIFTKVKIQQYTSWPDYVFEESHQLPTLAEIERYIQQNKHLPEVPSAHEVEKNGLDLGDNQSILLKKIEELTLYVIDINKKVEKLTEENTQLKKKLESINK